MSTLGTRLPHRLASRRPPAPGLGLGRPLVLAAILPCTGCTNFVFTGTSSQTVDVVREAMGRIQASEESVTRRLDLHPEELEMTFLLDVPRPAAADDDAPRPPSPDHASPPPPSAPTGPSDLRTILVRIVPWGDTSIRQRTITIDAWRWHGVPPMWGGSAQEAQLAANQAMSAVLAERSR